VITICHVIATRNKPSPEIAEKYVPQADLGATMVRLQARYDTVFVFRTFRGLVREEEGPHGRPQ
jgi:hypothetical protein